MIPSYYIPAMPWHGPSPALEFKTRAATMHHHTGFVVIARDRDTGFVYPDRPGNGGKVRVKYTTSPFDAHNLVEGCVAAAKIAYVCGAREILMSSHDLPTFVRNHTETEKDDEGEGGVKQWAKDGEGGKGEEGKSNENKDQDEDDDRFDEGINDPAFQNWLAQLRRISIKCPDPDSLGCAHQMGTCRMSPSPAHGVVDYKGRVWGYGGRSVEEEQREQQERRARAQEEKQNEKKRKNINQEEEEDDEYEEDDGDGDEIDDGDVGASLYVADASCFPSASGVNPMVTTLAIAEWISRGLVRDMMKRKRRRRRTTTTTTTRKKEKEKTNKKKKEESK